MQAIEKASQFFIPEIEGWFHLVRGSIDAVVKDYMKHRINPPGRGASWMPHPSRSPGLIGVSPREPSMVAGRSFWGISEPSPHPIDRDTTQWRDPLRDKEHRQTVKARVFVHVCVCTCLLSNCHGPCMSQCSFSSASVSYNYLALTAVGASSLGYKSVTWLKPFAC